MSIPEVEYIKSLVRQEIDKFIRVYGTPPSENELSIYIRKSIADQLVHCGDILRGNIDCVKANPRGGCLSFYGHPTFVVVEYYLNAEVYHPDVRVVVEPNKNRVNLDIIEESKCRP